MIPALWRSLSYLLLVPAVLPLVFANGLLYPYLTPKTLLFRGAFILTAAVFAVLALSGRQFYFARLKNPISWIPGALLVLAYVSSALGADFYHSFWSLFDRGDGLLTLTAAVGFFYFTLLHADEAFFSRFLRVVAWVASLVAVMGVLQWLQAGSGMDIPLVPEPHGRVGSTLGNAAFMASFLGLSVFLTYVILPQYRGRWKTAVQVSIALQLLAILASATRGSLLALLGAGFLVLLHMAWKGSGASRSYARGGLAAMLVLAGLFLSFRAQLASVPFAPVARLASISVADATVESRLFIWQNITGRALEHPLTGVGAENISILFNEVYDPTQIVEEWFDRTHNAFLDYFVQYGALGLALYLALIAAFLRFAFALMRGEREDDARLGRAFVLLGLVYAAQNFFVFDTATTLWLFLTLLAFLLARRDAAARSALAAPKFPSAAPLALGGVLALATIPVVFMPLYANLLLADGYSYHVYDVRRTVDSVEKGYGMGTYANMEYGYQLYEMYTERQATMLSGESRLRAYRLARDVLAENYAMHPYDARTAVYYGHVLDQAPSEERPDEELVRSVLTHAIDLSPKRIQPRFLLANIAIRKGDAEAPGSPAKKRYYDEAIQGLIEYADALPNSAEPRFIIATLYQSLGENIVAAQWAEEGSVVYERKDENTARRAARFYVTAGDWENARRFLRDVVETSTPVDYPIMYDLAKAEFLAGDAERAQEIVAELRQKSPGLVEQDPAFLAALGE